MYLITQNLAVNIYLDSFERCCCLAVSFLNNSKQLVNMFKNCADYPHSNVLAEAHRNRETLCNLTVTNEK